MVCKLPECGLTDNKIEDKVRQTALNNFNTKCEVVRWLFQKVK